MLYMKTNINVYNNAPQGKFLIQIEKKLQQSSEWRLTM